MNISLKIFFLTISWAAYAADIKQLVRDYVVSHQEPDSCRGLAVTIGGSRGFDAYIFLEEHVDVVSVSPTFAALSQQGGELSPAQQFLLMCALNRKSASWQRRELRLATANTIAHRLTELTTVFATGMCLGGPDSYVKGGLVFLIPVTIAITLGAAKLLKTSTMAREEFVCAAQACEDFDLETLTVIAGEYGDHFAADKGLLKKLACCTSRDSVQRAISLRVEGLSEPRI